MLENKERLREIFIDELKSCSDITKNKKLKEIKKEIISDSLFQYSQILTEEQLKNTQDGKDRTLENIKKGTISLSNPKSFNDPYDCNLEFNGKEKNLITFDTLVAELANESSENNPQIKIEGVKNPEVRKTLKTILDKDPKNRVLISIIKMAISNESDNQKNKMNELFGNNLKVSCFTETNKSLLMWAHYAKNHTGVCIEYGVDNFLDNNLINYIYPVEYSDYKLDPNIANLELNQIDLPKEVLKRLLRKSIEWKYEREWRLIFSNKTKRNIKIGLPKAVYIGANMNIKEAKKVSALCEEKKIPCYIMKKAEHYFSLEETKYNNNDNDNENIDTSIASYETIIKSIEKQNKNIEEIRNIESKSKIVKKVKEIGIEFAQKKLDILNEISQEEFELMLEITKSLQATPDK